MNRKNMYRIVQKIYLGLLNYSLYLIVNRTCLKRCYMHYWCIDCPITDKGTIKEAFIKRKNTQQMFVKKRQIIYSSSRFDKYVCCDNALLSFARNLRLWSPDTKDDIEIFSVSFDKRLANNCFRLVFQLMHDTKLILCLV